ncbi:5-methylcytosine-specific restriction protein A [Vespertiliibacter pulmonis]|uniref:5-methylcytosine-specific restriction protein A n=1 Tax=Vespertiliibacter pulmonis TaxID=1443036 RepID=A0A3N4VLA4_9PAST|nr:HNH endonuclease [Vespertiliibacter pulmonis]RPE83872.1 5-methylcytosine-specific restriction protein A [Vespertiliibacter pulmonis]
MNDGYRLPSNKDATLRDYFSNVHKYLMEVIDECYLKVQMNEYSSEEKNELNTIIQGKEEDNVKSTELSQKSISFVKRNLSVAKEALCKADYKCEVDDSHKLFLRKGDKGINYTEAHHLIPLYKYKDVKSSLDIVANIISLCSHCHNLLHYGRYEDKLEILEKLYKERKNALEESNITITFDKLITFYD